MRIRSIKNMGKSKPLKREIVEKLGIVLALRYIAYKWESVGKNLENTPELSYCACVIEVDQIVIDSPVRSQVKWNAGTMQ